MLQGWIREGIWLPLDDHKLISPVCLQPCARCWKLRKEEQRRGQVRKSGGEQGWQGKQCLTQGGPREKKKEKLNLSVMYLISP